MSFHIHQIHFLVESQDNFEVNGSQPDPSIQGQMLDTIQTPFWDGNPDHPFPSVTVRMDFRGPDIGDFVYHCHIAGHEDDGMMAIIRIEPSAHCGHHRENSPLSHCAGRISWLPSRTGRRGRTKGASLVRQETDRIETHRWDDRAGNTCGQLMNLQRLQVRLPTFGCGKDVVMVLRRFCVMAFSFIVRSVTYIPAANAGL